MYHIKTKAMKIAYCVLGTFNSGGMERVLANKANYLAKLGHEVTIITTDQQERAPYYFLDERIQCVDLQINYTEDLTQGLAKRLLSYVLKQKKHKAKLQVLLAEKKQDLVISLFDHDAAILPHIDDGSKKVLEIHFSRFKRLQYNRRGLWKWIDKYRSFKDLSVVKSFSRFVVLTEEDKCYWGALPHIQVIPNANSFIPKNLSTGTSKRVIAVGRYDAQKNFSDLIKVWQLVANVHPEWSLTIYGHGPQKEQLQRQIDQYGLRDSITLHPPVKDIENAYLNSSILAMTSRYEGLPMALLEAQVCGLPLVSYACKCGPRDIIHPGINGYLIGEGDVQGMADKLVTLMLDQELRTHLARNAAQMAQNYGEEKIMNQWLSLFEDLLRSNKKTSTYKTYR